MIRRRKAKQLDELLDTSPAVALLGPRHRENGAAASPAPSHARGATAAGWTGRIIVRRDSPNGKRYARKDRADNLITPSR